MVGFPCVGNVPFFSKWRSWGVLERPWGGPGGSSGAPRRFSGHGFNRAWASDSIAQSLLLLISQPFHSVFSYMDSNGDPLGSLSALGGAWGALGGSRRFSGHGFNRALAFDSMTQGLFLLIS